MADGTPFQEVKMSIGNITNSALSAIAAFGTGLNVTANNIANMNTEGFKPTRAIMNEEVNGGVKVTLSQSENPEVDIAKELVDMMIEKHGIQANVKTLQTEDQVLKSLIDIKV
jgi:flagellar hook protein FlgE